MKYFSKNFGIIIFILFVGFGIGAVGHLIYDTIVERNTEKHQELRYSEKYQKSNKTICLDTLNCDDIKFGAYTFSDNYPDFKKYANLVNLYSNKYNVSTNKIYLYKLWYNRSNLSTNYKSEDFYILVASTMSRPSVLDGQIYIVGLDDTYYSLFLICYPVK